MNIFPYEFIFSYYHDLWFKSERNLEDRGINLFLNYQYELHNRNIYKDIPIL